MKVETKGHTTTIRDIQGDLNAFVMKLTHEYKTFEKHNLIVDISANDNVTVKDMGMFMELAKTHNKARKSFVVVAAGIDYNKVPSKLTVVPTRLEAHDIIEMEEIERDLGF